MLTWMAWTWPTALLFCRYLFRHGNIDCDRKSKTPEVTSARGCWVLVTTRGDRLFITLLGSVYIHLAWLGWMGMPLWIPLGLSVCVGCVSHSGKFERGLIHLINHLEILARWYVMQ